jgi:spermidine/putrescine transport system permease protein
VTAGTAGEQPNGPVSAGASQVGSRAPGASGRASAAGTQAPPVSGGATAAGTAPPATLPGAPQARRGPRSNPWGHPWFLEGFTWLYLIWSLVPIVIAVLFSFNDGKSQSVWQGFSLRWYTSDPLQSVLHNPVLHNPVLHSAVLQTLKLSLYTTLIAVPLGVAFAVGLSRWRGPLPATANFMMILSFVIPELIFGVAMFFVFTALFTSVRLGTLAETLGLVTWNVSWPAIIVQARLATIGRQYEEAAADLGATRLQTVRRVLLPLLAPAVFASAVLVFSGVIDDFVLVDMLSSTANTQPMSVLIYSSTRGGNGGPALNALGTIMLAMSFVIAMLGYLGYRWLSRGERRSGVEALTSIAGEG